jgi:hypothetical protein
LSSFLYSRAVSDGMSQPYLADATPRSQAYFKVMSQQLDAFLAKRSSKDARYFFIFSAGHILFKRCNAQSLIPATT